MTGAVLLSSAGRRVALLESFRTSMRSLGVDGRVLATDRSAAASAFQLADARFLVPSCSDAGFIPALLEICRREHVTLVVPTIDPELPVLAAAREEFASIGTTIAVSSPDTVAIGADKRATNAWLRTHGFPTVRQASVADVLDAPGEWKFPVITKPFRGSASIGVERARSLDELALRADDDDVVVESVAAGVEYTVDVLVDSAGSVRCAVPRRRLETRGGEVSKAVTVRSATLIDLVSELASALPGAFGALNVQLFATSECQHPEVIEINARFGGGYPLSYAAGADFPGWLLEDVLGLPSSARADEWRGGVVMLRYDDAVFVDCEAAGLSS
jgi:carbamoyl-phosphate synthase large subunit